MQYFFNFDISIAIAGFLLSLLQLYKWHGSTLVKMTVMVTCWLCTMPPLLLVLNVETAVGAAVTSVTIKRKMTLLSSQMTRGIDM